MRRAAIAGLVLLGLVGCSGGTPAPTPLATDLAHRLERAGLCPHPRINRHRRREVLCAPRPDGGRTGVATFGGQGSTLHSVELERQAAEFLGCDEHASHGEISFVIGHHFTVVGSDRPDAVARVLGARVSRPSAACRPSTTAPAAAQEGAKTRTVPSPAPT
jgi:hypothetical protein